MTQKPTDTPTLPERVDRVTFALNAPINFEPYIKAIEAEDYSHEEAKALVGALYGILSGFIDLAFGIDPVSLSCGQDTGAAQKQPSPMLSCTDYRKYLKSQFSEKGEAAE